MKYQASGRALGELCKNCKLHNTAHSMHACAFPLVGAGTVCLGSTNKLCLCWKLKQVNLLESISKIDSVIEMTFLYDARYSWVLLRPKNEPKLSTQSADKWMCMGKWPVPCEGKAQDVQIFQGLPLLPMRSLKKLARTDEEVGREKIKTRIERSIFCQFLANFRILSPRSRNSNYHDFVHIRFLEPHLWTVDSAQPYLSITEQLRHKK